MDFDIAAAGGDLRVLIWQQVLAVRWQPIPTFDGLTRFRTIQSRHIRSLAGKKAVIISYSNASGNDLHFDPGSRDLVAAVTEISEGRYITSINNGITVNADVYPAEFAPQAASAASSIPASASPYQAWKRKKRRMRR